MHVAVTVKRPFFTFTLFSHKRKSGSVQPSSPQSLVKLTFYSATVEVPLTLCNPQCQCRVNPYPANVENMVSS